MTPKQENILIIGAGLCGSLLALRLAQRGYNVTVMEMRPDLRSVDISAGKSINLAFSDRGNKGMKLVGIEDKVLPLCIPMRGRMLHDKDGNTQAYAARFDDGKWRIHQISDWEGKHIFKGGGSGPSTYGTHIRIGTIKRHGEGKMALPFSHWKAGRGLLVVDEETLKQISEITGGQYFRAIDQEELESVYTTLDELEPIEFEEEENKPITPLFYYPLVASLIIGFVLLFLRGLYSLSKSKMS